MSYCVGSGINFLRVFVWGLVVNLYGFLCGDRW